MNSNMEEEKKVKNIAVFTKKLKFTTTNKSTLNQDKNGTRNPAYKGNL